MLDKSRNVAMVNVLNCITTEISCLGSSEVTRRRIFCSSFRSLPRLLRLSRKNWVCCDKIAAVQLDHLFLAPGLYCTWAIGLGRSAVGCTPIWVVAMSIFGMLVLVRFAGQDSEWVKSLLVSTGRWHNCLTLVGAGHQVISRTPVTLRSSSSSSRFCMLA